MVTLWLLTLNTKNAHFKNKFSLNETKTVKRRKTTQIIVPTQRKSGDSKIREISSETFEEKEQRSQNLQQK